ncbi:MAG TPA: SMC family ATPase [bacterium]|nr:SMC family ATPase [bacterium]HPP02682.1 SMC family ATPase [bacterium]HXK94035.1 SMC family ATPase [bacterium]
MILRKIRAANWKCFIDPVEVGPFSETLNIIHAPNATGKSTLFEAFRRALLDGHRVRGQEMEAIRPLGRSLAPQVMVEFCHDGIDYRITKQYLDNAKSVLERKEQGAFVRWKEGTDADQWCQGILTQNPPGRGLFRQANWGLAQVLWAPQGDMRLPDFSGDVIGGIQAALGEQISGPDAGPLEKRIKELYSEIYTEGGRIRTGANAPRIIFLREELERVKGELQEAQLRLQAYEQSSRNVADLRQRREYSKSHLESLRVQRIEIQRQVEQYKALLSEKKQREEQVKTAEAQYNLITQRIQQIHDAANELQKCQSNLTGLLESLPLRQNELQLRERELNEIRTALEDIRKNRPAIDEAESLAKQAQRFVETRRQREELNLLVTKIQRARLELDQRRDARTRFLAPDAKTLRDIRRAMKERDEAQTRIESALISLEIVPEHDGSLEAIAAENPGSVPLHEGIPGIIKGSPDVVVNWPGVARIRATGPVEDITPLRNEHAAAVQKIEDLTAPFQTRDIDQLEALAERAKEMDLQIRDAATQFDTLLAGRTLEEIEQQRAELEGLFQTLLQEHPEWEANPPDYQRLWEQAEKLKAEFIEQVENAERRQDTRQTAFNAAKEEKIKLDTLIEGTQSQQRALEAKLNNLKQDGKTEAQRMEERNQILLNLDLAQVKLEEIEKKLLEFGEDPSTVAARLEKQYEEAQKAAEAALVQEKEEEARLENLCAQAPYSLWAAADEKRQKLESEIHAEEERIAAIRLLYDTLTQCRAEAIAAVTGPVETIASRILYRIAGSRLGRIRLNEKFTTAAVLPDTYDNEVPMDLLSGGEQEQCYLATRIALAEVLSRHDKQLVVLDDTMVFTDPGRFSRVLNILEEYAEKMQLLILTCHPERYFGLESATRFDLEALRRCAGNPSGSDTPA